MTENRAELVAYCGLYCGTCGGYKKGRCAGCKPGGGFNACGVRKCCLEKGYRTCADCTQYFDLAKCGKLCNPISRLIGLFKGSNRPASLRDIKTLGIEEFARRRAGGSVDG